MTLHRRNEGLALVDSWIEEALHEEAPHHTGIIAKPIDLDSHRLVRPLSVVRPVHQIGRLSELKELSLVLESESESVREWLDAFEPSRRYRSAF